MRVTSSKMGKLNFQKPSSSWLQTSVSSCLGHPFRWGISPAWRQCPLLLLPTSLFLGATNVLFFSPYVLQIILRTTSWSFGHCLTSSCRASWERNASSLLGMENPFWPAVTPKVPHESRRQVCEHCGLPLLGGFVGTQILSSHSIIPSSRCAGNGGPAPAGASIPSEEDEGGRPSGSSP